MKLSTLLLSATLTLQSLYIAGQNAPEVVIPKSDDKYAEYVKKLEAGETDIDFQDFRFSFIESKQFLEAEKKSSKFEDLKKDMYRQMNKKKYTELIKTTKQMLSIDYTSMIAHKILRQTYKIIGDTVNAQKYKTIQFGLLNSIVKKGDGKSCSTAWPVIKISEEYFILEMVGAELKQQSIDNEGGLCDKMDVIVDGNDKTYYFETSKVFEGYKKMGIK